MDNEDLDLAKANAGAGCALIAFALFVVPAVFGVVLFFGAMIWSLFQRLRGVCTGAGLFSRPPSGTMTKTG